MGGFDDETAFQSNIPVPLDITVAVVYSLFGICSLFGNSTLLYVSYKKKHLLKPAEFFIINLAVSDLGLTLSLYPLAITSSFYHRWLYGTTVCSIYAFCGILFGICSLSTLTLFSMVCFVKVCYPLYGNRFSCIHGRLLVAFAWLYALLFACSPLGHWGEYGPEPYGTACCIDWRLSNRLPTVRSYTVVLFFFCYILPCALILASYAGILTTVHASHKTMEHHASRHMHMSRIQIVIIKLSMAVSIGFFVAWTPYALVSMWASFGNIKDIPPVAFAIPAMFAKSSTIYNPIVYLAIRPNFRKVIFRDLAALKHHTGKCCCHPRIKVRLQLGQRRTEQFPLPTSSTQPPMIVLNRHKDTAECSGDGPQVFCVANAAAYDKSSKERVGPSVSHTRSVLCLTCAKRTPDSFHINLELVPDKAKVAWP
ncbi:opsin-5-like [Hippocampus zosterae]|uniref:opsin-5-like n=1 Tax=Hippocampus zosterae TaxID=109293 RepID=UPI00223E0510|nr:opsin-5-like [Hippocampus zosterae]XP_051943801.1 opsin-5-like [Hippocampus zosterae]XP_051943802.1 opsin-5-like [Hippocampus zosterae]